MKRWPILPAWLRPVGSAVIAAVFAGVFSVSIRLLAGHWAAAWWLLIWFASGFLGGCIGDYITSRRKSKRIVPRVVESERREHNWQSQAYSPGDRITDYVFALTGEVCTHCGARRVFEGPAYGWRYLGLDSHWDGGMSKTHCPASAAPATSPATPEKGAANNKENL